ncbi:MAG: hypothetical protein JWN14_1467, partial [Chthonomonadales bacterium]|nr:hypothetical protein [Chthonomonadales bacterium]
MKMRCDLGDRNHRLQGALRGEFEGSLRL